MGNNNQEPLSNEISGGLFSADGPLFLWQEFMQLALNNPWDWNGQAPVPQTSFDQPPGIVTATVCRWSGMAATTNCGQIITLPFLEGTVPPLDNVHSRGCLDLEAYIAQATPTRPNNWLIAADTWSDRLVNGQTGSRGDPANYKEDLRVQFAITPALRRARLPIRVRRARRASERRRPRRAGHPSRRLRRAAAAADGVAAVAVAAVAAAGPTRQPLHRTPRAREAFRPRRRSDA